MSFFKPKDGCGNQKMLTKSVNIFILTLSTLIGMNFMVSAGDFLIFYIGLETATIPIAGLAAFDKLKSKSAEAGIKLILSSALSSGILLFGLSMIYGATGSIYFADIATKVQPNALIALGFVFFVSGMGFKISLVPFHFWTADVYEGAPINVTSYLSVVSKGAAAFIFTIVLFTVFKNIVELWKPMIYTLAIATMTIGNLFAMRQNNIKRFFGLFIGCTGGFYPVGYSRCRRARNDCNRLFRACLCVHQSWSIWGLLLPFTMLRVLKQFQDTMAYIKQIRN